MKFRKLISTPLFYDSAIDIESRKELLCVASSAP
jgi:hypothetical protein